jgi:NAD(P)-dependent dehydrogenase (short-subunit alcohol dehydrogenase family)
MGRTHEGKVVLVTGANSGIGEAAAVAFLESGATVFGVARRQETLEAARARHPQIQWLLADVTVRSQVDAAIASARRHAGRLDVLVNNAGIFLTAPIDQASEEAVRRQLDINIIGPTLVTQAALPDLKASRGVIINLSSVAARKPLAGAGHYCATKAAIELLTQTWALELAPFGIRVNAVAPGPIETPLFGKAGLAPNEIPALQAS